MATLKTRKVVISDGITAVNASRGELVSARKSLTREEYERFLEEERLAKVDPVAGLTHRKETLEKRLADTTNPFLKAQIQATLEGIESTIKEERALQAAEQQDREMHEAEQMVLRDRALQEGPLFSQRLAWWWQDKTGRLAKLGRKIASSLSLFFRHLGPVAGRWYDAVLPILTFLTMFGGIVNALVLMVSCDLGFNFIGLIISSMILLAGYTGSERKDRYFRTVFLAAVLTLYGTATFYGCIGPVGAYVGAVRQANGQIVRMVDARAVFFMQPPKLWRGESMAWKKLPDYTQREVAAPDKKLDNGQLSVSAVVMLREDNFKEFLESTATVWNLQDDIQSRLNQEVASFALSGTPTPAQLNELKMRIAKIRNPLFAMSVPGIKVSAILRVDAN